MKIVYTKHALKKFKDLEKLGIVVSKRRVNLILRKPLGVDERSDYPKKIAWGKLNHHHILKVVFKQESDRITVITFYPSRKERYQ